MQHLGPRKAIKAMGRNLSTSPCATVCLAYMGMDLPFKSIEYRELANEIRFFGRCLAGLWFKLPP